VTGAAAILAQLLHTALVLAVAPVVLGLRRWIEARLSGRAGPPPWQPWSDLRRLIRKQPVLAENAALMSRTTPVACLAASALAVALVPSFALGMAFAPLADLLVILGLLAVGRIALALVSLEAGTAQAGVMAGRGAALAGLAEPALYLAILALGLLGGTTNLDLLIGTQLQGMLQPLGAAVLALGALALVALAGPGSAGLTTELSGADLALVEFAASLRELVWLDLLIGLLLPLGMAEPGGGPAAWIAGLFAWGIKVVVVTAGLAGLRRVAGDIPPAQRPRALGVAAILGALAALLALASAVAA